MKATVLIDNIPGENLTAEWGLAIYIEQNGHRLLLDTGASGKFLDNADKLGLDLRQVECGVLSHAHSDHSDGLAAFFARNPTAKFYLRSGAGETCYGKRWIFKKYIGIHKGYLTKFADRIVYADGDCEILPGVMLLPHKTPGLEQVGKRAGMYVRQNGRFCPDCFAHEQSLVVETAQGLVIFNSCSHGGADNIIKEVMQTFPDKPIYALIGGFHLFASSEQEVRALAARIRDTGIARIYTGHCTGQKAMDILKEELGERAQQLYTGMEIVI